MSIALYKDEALTDQVSRNGSMDNPTVTEIADGSIGGNDEDFLVAAAEQTTLAAAVTTVGQTEIELTAARFADTRFDLILLGDAGGEIAKITAGFGTTTLTVIREWKGSAGTYAIGEAVKAAYDYTSVVVSVNDNEQVATDDESDWRQYAPDAAGSPGSYGAAGASINLGNIANSDTVKFWFKDTVPASTSPQRKTDLEHVPAFSAIEMEL